MDEKSISESIKNLRTARQLTLQDLADRTGLTKGYLSKVERSKKAPPYSTLNKIAAGLDIELTSLLAGDASPVKDVRLFLSKKEKRPLIRETDIFAGYDYEPLAEGKPGKNMEPFIIHAPFAINRTYTHEGEETIHVLDGRLEFHYGDEVYNLNVGDNIYFDSIVPHVGKSLGRSKAKLLVVIYFYKRNRF
ncbi:XRE family transcriptional regulator [uncultured Desulfobacter sp.]|uniref:helix-turn-helix domain-containing protein n=1 Tax=uncultured Desulfobacter sp. TaxID=240139 RepID=UPI002AA67668|nr:XRE family transcriptional regulator [uncultured Desulfobacter sp.]